MKTTTETVRIRLDQALAVEDRKKIDADFNLSKFLREKLDEEFGLEDLIAIQERKNKEEFERLQQLKKEIKERKVEKISDRENEWIEETRELINNNPKFTEGRWRQYKNEFGRRISLAEFQELMKGGGQNGNVHTL